jgi:hypothetical protein
MLGIVIIIAAAAVLIGTRHIFSSSILGSGNVTTETRAVSAFSTLKLDGVFKVVITQDGGPAWVKVETDQNLQRTVVISHDGETLEIKSNSSLHFSNPTKMLVYVNVKDITVLENANIGSVETQGKIKAQELYLKNDAVGKTMLDIAVHKLTAKLNAMGTTILRGSATEAELDNNSVGKLKAFGLHAEVLHITNNAVGAVEIYAEKEISIHHNGVGSLCYKGPAAVKELKDEGVGKVSKAD